MTEITPKEIKQIVMKLQQYPSAYIEPRNEKDSRHLSKLSDELMIGMSALVPLINEVMIDHLLARNDVIINVMLKDYALLLTAYENQRQRIVKLSKQDQRLSEFYTHMVKIPADYAVNQVIKTAELLSISVDIVELKKEYKLLQPKLIAS